MSLSIGPSRPVVLVNNVGNNNGAALFRTVYKTLCKLGVRGGTRFRRLLGGNTLKGIRPAVILRLSFRNVILKHGRRCLLHHACGLGPTGGPIRGILLGVSNAPFSCNATAPPRRHTVGRRRIGGVVGTGLPRRLDGCFLFSTVRSDRLLGRGIFTRVVGSGVRGIVKFGGCLRLGGTTRRRRRR